MYDGYVLLVIAPVTGLTIAVLGHFALAWMTGGERAYRCVLQGFLCGAVATLVVSLVGLRWMQEIAFEDGFVLVVFNLVIFAALGFCYVNFVGLSIASLRIRVLQELLAHPEGLRLENILERYNPKVLIDNRIDRLTAGRQIVEKEGRFHSGRRGILWAARIMVFMKFFILGRRGKERRTK
jgi:hypothetical protein